MSKLIGGEIIGTGAFGCVHKPQMECADDAPMPSPDAVSKIMLNRYANAEMEEFKAVALADPTQIIHLGTPTKCDVKNNDENQIAFSGCKALQKPGPIYPDDYALLIMKDGGQDITDFAHAVYGWEITDENKNKIELFWLEVSRLFYGLKVFKDAGLIHRDINHNNIVYNINTNRLNFIDFGVMTRKKDIVSNANLSQKRLNFNIESGWSSPWETSKLHKDEFTKIINYNDNPRHNEELKKSLDPPLIDRYFFESIMPLISHKLTEEGELTEEDGLTKKQKLIDEYEKKLTEMKLNMSAAYYNMMMAHNPWDWSEFLNKSIDTIDSYGVGLALLYALTRSGKFLDPILYNKLNVLFTTMINPSVYDRHDVNVLIVEYNKIMEGSGILAKHNRHYDEHFLLVNNAVEAPQPAESKELPQTPIVPPPVPESVVLGVVPGGRFRPRSRKSCKMSKSTRQRKPTKRMCSRKANKAKRSHKKR